MLEEVDLSNFDNRHLSRNIWLVSFYFAGMRISDVLRLKWSDFKDGRLHYKMGKNEKGGSFLVPEKANQILEQYKNDEPKHDFVFPFLKVLDDANDTFNEQRKINHANNLINKNLKKVAASLGIDKNLTMHIARHTFGNLSGDKIPIHLLQKLYRRSSVVTTIGYQSNFVNKDLDNALKKVVD